ncbi:hypothetical protein BGX21_004770 [Mortierella sp. AD011]|nr:hypothetical protein BGX20_008611 [Mortierella sp. AD010]KAF9400209.1 hypothetical protein BGX21_004770 [Mortierella sp. AD011]
MALESAPNFHQYQYQHQQHLLHHRNHSDDTFDALKVAASVPFYHNTTPPTSLTSITRQPALSPITTTIPSPVHLTRPSNPLDHPSPNMTSTRGPHKPLTLQQHATHVTALPSPHSAQFRAHHHQVSSLPSPPLSSVEPPLNANFFPKSPMQERCEALENELSTLRLRLKQSERSSNAREKRMSIFQHQTSDTQQSLQAATLQFESTSIQLWDTEQRLNDMKTSLAHSEDLVRQLEATNHEQKCKLDEILSERESLVMEMKDSYAESTKLQKRIKTSSERVEKLQQENRQLMEQLDRLRAEVTQKPDTQPNSVERGGRGVIELEKEANKYKAEVGRLQDLVLMMSNRHVQVQAQLTFFQQQAQQLEHQLDQSHQDSTTKTPVLHWTNSSTATTSTARKHGSLMMGESTLASLLTSVASVAVTSHSRHTKPTRRYTVNAPRKDGELTLEKRKCEFLMEQISVLQRGYDSLRQEKVTLELQIDLMQRQHQYHQQQRQKRRESQRRTLGHEQSTTLSNALAIMVSSPPNSSGANALSAIPSTPLLPTISAAEQEREKARIQYELEQAQVRAQKEAQDKEAQRLAAKAAAEEAEREAIRLKRAKSLHLKETLASLESKRDRSDSRNIQISSSEELKHLEHLRLINDQQQAQYRSSTESGKKVSNTAAIRASRRVASPFSPGNRQSDNSSSSSSGSPSPLSAITTPSPLSFHSTQNKQAAKYTHPKNQLAVSHLPSYTYKIEQCSCCLGAMIEI